MRIFTFTVDLKAGNSPSHEVKRTYRLKNRLKSYKKQSQNKTNLNMRYSLPLSLFRMDCSVAAHG